MENQEKPSIVETMLESLAIKHYKDEPFFVLLGRDPAAPDVIQMWCKAREQAVPGTQKVLEADQIALSMRQFKALNPHLGLDISTYQAGISKLPLRKTVAEKTHRAFILAVDDAYFRDVIPTNQVGFQFNYEKPVNAFPMSRFFAEANSYLSIREREYLDNSKLPGSEKKGDTKYRQLLPYIIPRQVQPDGSLMYYPYRRTKKVGESRLAGNGSIGYGGHPELEDVVFTKSVIDLESTLQLGTLREADEEFTIQDQDGVEVSIESTHITFGNLLILDDSNDVGQLHVGIVMYLDVPVGCALLVKEDELSNLPPMTAEQMLSSPDFAPENWTRQYLEAAHADIADRLTLNHGDEEMVDMHDYGFSEPMSKSEAEAHIQARTAAAETDSIDLTTEAGQAAALESMEAGAASLTPDQEAEAAFGPGHRAFTDEEFAVVSADRPALTEEAAAAMADKLKATAPATPDFAQLYPNGKITMLKKMSPNEIAGLPLELADAINPYEFDNMTVEQLDAFKPEWLELMEQNSKVAYAAEATRKGAKMQLSVHPEAEAIAAVRQRSADAAVETLLEQHAKPGDAEEIAKKVIEDFSSTANPTDLAAKINAIQNPTRTTASGLVIIDNVVGKGNEAQLGFEVMVHYTGYLVNNDLSAGTKFDASRDRGTPFRFDLGGGKVIKGWEEGIVGMRVGGKRRLLVPAELAYGEAGAYGTIPPNAKLMFDIELIAV